MSGGQRIDDNYKVYVSFFSGVAGGFLGALGSQISSLHATKQYIKGPVNGQKVGALLGTAGAIGLEYSLDATNEVYDAIRAIPYLGSFVPSDQVEDADKFEIPIFRNIRKL